MVVVVLAHGLGGTNVGPVSLSTLVAALAAALVGTAALAQRREVQAPGRVPGHARVRGAGSGAAPPEATAPADTLEAGSAGWTVPAWLRSTLRTTGLVGGLVVVLGAALGSGDESLNAAPRLVLSVAWALVALVAVLAGPWWGLVDPLRPVASGLARLSGDPEGAATRPLPAATPFLAAFAVGAVAWAAEVRTPTTFAFLVWLSAYALGQLAGAAVCGRAWLDRVGAFTATARLLGRLARPRPRHGLEAATDAAAIDLDATDLAVAGALVGWGLADLVVETDAWHNLALGGSEATVWGTVVLAAAISLATLLLGVVARRAGVTRAGGRAVAALAAGWVGAQHAVTLATDGHAALVWLSDPLRRGWDLLGTSGWAPPGTLLPEWLAATLTVCLFAAGHLAAVAAGHRAAVGRWGPARAGAAQLEWRALLLASLCGGTALLLGGL